MLSLKLLLLLNNTIIVDEFTHCDLTNDAVVFNHNKLDSYLLWIASLWGKAHFYGNIRIVTV